MTLLEIVCDTQAEANFAVAWCQQKNYQNITVRQAEQIQMVEVEGAPPNYVFSGKYARVSQALWKVSAEK